MPRLNDALAASQSRASKAEDAGRARIIAIVGVVAGVLGPARRAGPS